MRTFGIAIALIALSSTVASADAVGPPPTDCPAGTNGASSHTGPYCAPALCNSDADCTGRSVCRDESMCIASQACGGLGFDGGPYPDGGSPLPCMFDTVRGLCPGVTACGAGACMTRHVCVPPPMVGVASSGCACSVGRRDALGGLLTLAAIGLTALVRRRSRAWRA